MRLENVNFSNHCGGGFRCLGCFRQDGRLGGLGDVGVGGAWSFAVVGEYVDVGSLGSFGLV